MISNDYNPINPIGWKVIAFKFWDFESDLPLDMDINWRSKAYTEKFSVHHFMIAERWNKTELRAPIAQSNKLRIQMNNIHGQLGILCALHQLLIGTIERIAGAQFLAQYCCLQTKAK